MIFVIVKRKRTWLIKYGKIFYTERTPEQEALFYKSVAYYNHMKDMSKFKKATYIRYGIGWGLLAVGLVLLWVLDDYFVGGIIMALGGLMSLGLDLFIASMDHGRTVRSVLDWKVTDCIKCGGNNEIIKSRYLRTESDVREETSEHRTYQGKGEVIGHLQPRFQGNKRLYAFQVKYTYYYYDVTRKCSQCGEEIQQEETFMSRQDEVGIDREITNIHIENFHEAPKPLAPFFCAFCGSKNKGENVKCENCGGNITNPNRE